MKKYITLQKFCEMTGFKYTTTIKWILAGIIPARIFKNGKKSKYFLAEKEIEEWFEKHKVTTI